MANQSGRTISFQLSTSNTDKLANVSRLGDGHYVQKLNPPVPVPFYASPKVALWSLSFSNTFANVDHENFANDKLLWQVGANAPVTLTIPKGNYRMSDLEIAIAQQLRDTQAAIWTQLNRDAQAIKSRAKDSTIWDLDSVPHAIAGVADPAVASQWSDVGADGTAPLTFLELQQLARNHKTLIDLMSPIKRYVKPVTLRHNPQTNRIECILLGNSSFAKGSTLATEMLGFDEGQLANGANNRFKQNALVEDSVWEGTTAPAAKTANYALVPANSLSVPAKPDTVPTANRAALIDNVRQISVHLPGLAAGSYDRDGQLTGAQVASVPIRAAPGDSEAYEVNNPLWMPCTIAGSYVDSIEWYITNEVGKRIDNQNGHMEATIVLQWPAPSGEAAPPSSFSAKTDLSRVVQAWSGLKK